MWTEARERFGYSDGERYMFAAPRHWATIKALNERGCHRKQGSYYLLLLKMRNSNQSDGRRIAKPTRYHLNFWGREKPDSIWVFWGRFELACTFF